MNYRSFDTSNPKEKAVPKSTLKNEDLFPDKSGRPSRTVGYFLSLRYALVLCIPAVSQDCGLIVFCDG